MLLAGSARPPVSAEIGLPGARYTAAKITKLAISRLASSMASLRAKNCQRTGSAGPAQAVGPGREHVREGRGRAGEVVAQQQQIRRLDVGDPGQLLIVDLLGLHHERGPLIRAGRAARLLEQGGELGVVEVVVVLRPPGQVEGG